MAAGADLVLACHNARGCEGAAVMAAAPGGTAVFFSMATSFAQANLATDAAGKDVNCLFGVGLAPEQDKVRCAHGGGRASSLRARGGRRGPLARFTRCPSTTLVLL